MIVKAQPFQSSPPISVDSAEKQHTINRILRQTFGPRRRPRRRSGTTSDLKKKKELMAIM